MGNLCSANFDHVVNITSLKITYNFPTSEYLVSIYHVPGSIENVLINSFNSHINHYKDGTDTHFTEKNNTGIELPCIAKLVGDPRAPKDGIGIHRSTCSTISPTEMLGP